MEREGDSKQKAAPVKYTIILAVITAGILLQITTGQFPYELIRFPVNLIMVVVLITLATLKQGKILAIAGSLPVSLFLIALIAIQSIVMGLMTDNSLKGSWPFAMTYFMLLINLALTVGRRARSFRLQDTGFILNHAGLFILLIASGLGAADSRHLFMTINEGESLDYAEDYETGDDFVLPFNITLEDFSMEFYSPKFFLIDAKSGIIEQLSDDSYQSLKMSSDSLRDSQPRKLMQIDQFRYISMGDPETKSYCSRVLLSRGNESGRREEIRVNHPVRSGSWWIYQYSYDRQMGNHSKYSILELVRDPWIIPAYIGLLMLMAGAVSLFWKGGKL